MINQNTILSLDDITNLPVDFFKKDKFSTTNTQTKSENTQDNLTPIQKENTETTEPSYFKQQTIQLLPEKNNQENLKTETKQDVPDLKVESLGKAESSVNEIFTKNKELLTLEEKAKNTKNKKADVISPTTVINNYNPPEGPSGVLQNRDPLESLKMQYRSMPAWRSQFG